MEAISFENIRVNENIHSQLEAFNRIAELAISNGIANSKPAIVDGLLGREAESTTGFMDGFAIPHTKSSEIKKPSVIILKSTNGIEWNSLDGSPVRFIISLLVPEEDAGITHLTLLSSLSRILIRSEVRDQLINASSASEIVEILSSVMKNT